MTNLPNQELPNLIYSLPNPYVQMDSYNVAMVNVSTKFFSAIPNPIVQMVPMKLSVPSMKIPMLLLNAIRQIV